MPDEFLFEVPTGLVKMLETVTYKQQASRNAATEAERTTFTRCGQPSERFSAGQAFH